MEISNNTRLSTFEGIQHGVDDLTRKYRNSIIEVFDDVNKKLMVFMPTGFGADLVQGHPWVNGKWGASVTLHTSQLYVQREYPANGLVQIGKNIYLLSRESKRQWRRGANEHTMQYDIVHKDPDKKGHPQSDVIYANAFSQEYMTPQTFAEYIKTGDVTIPKVVTNRVWTVSRDNYLVSLYFEDIFVGMCDRHMKYIPCKESFTLVEETLNEFGLQQI